MQYSYESHLHPHTSSLGENGSADPINCAVKYRANHLISSSFTLEEEEEEKGRKLNKYSFFFLTLK